MNLEGPFANSLGLESRRAADGAERRTDPLTGQEVIVAPGRRVRPQAAEKAPSRQTRPEHVPDCPLCAGNEHLTPPPTLTLTSPGSAEAWSVRVVPNLYPIVSETDGKTTGRRPASGIHEVIVDTRSHDRELPDLEADHASLLMEAFQQRLQALEARPRTRYAVIFKNRGAEAGTSLEHPHSQLVALDFMPTHVRRRVQLARRHLRRTRACLLCAIVEAERQAGVRIVFERDGFVAFAPYASTSAGEVLLVPLTHAPSFATASREERERLGLSLAALLRQQRDSFADPAYNLVLHTAPKRWHDDAALHWYWQLSPRLTRTAGLELATGLSVNPIAPEDAAARLRVAPASV